jgi:hypothetical protein
MWENLRSGIYREDGPMAKSRTDELFERLHAQGLRRRVAKTVADATGNARRGSRPPAQVRKVVDQLRGLANEIEDRATGGDSRKRKAAGQKAAATRKKNAAKRSASAKKGAQTRRKSTPKAKAR